MHDPNIIRTFMEAMRDIDKFQYMCMKVTELSEEVSKLTSTNGALYVELREQRAEAKAEREIAEQRHEREREEWALQMESLKASHKEEVDNLRHDHKVHQESLLLEIQALRLQLKSGRKKLFGGGKSERRSAIDKTKPNEDDRNDEENRFDGTPESLNASSSSDRPSCCTSENPSSEDSAKNAEELLKKLQREIKRKNPNAEIVVERRDYSKAKSYGDNVVYHTLDEYFALSEGERFEMRNGEIVKSYLKVIIRHPETIEEHVFECGTVICKDKDNYKTSDLVDMRSPIPGCIFGNSMLCYILDEKYGHNKPYTQIVEQLHERGFKISLSTLVDNVHRALDWIADKMVPAWDSKIRSAMYWMLDETSAKVGCFIENAGSSKVKKYLTRYIWCIRANLLKHVYFIYEGGRGAKVIEPYLKDFVGFYTTDGYQVYKIFDEKDDGADNPDKLQSTRKRSSCLTHKRRYFVDALGENKDEAMWFIDKFGEIFAVEHHCFKNGYAGERRLEERLKVGNTVTIMDVIERRLIMWLDCNYAGCGPLLKKALVYALREWPAMKRVLESGDVEVSNNLAEQMMRRIKMNLKTATNIGSEESAKHNAFIFSVIESCKLNKIAPIKYFHYLLGQLRNTFQPEEELIRHLPCHCTLAHA